MSILKYFILWILLLLVFDISAQKTNKSKELKSVSIVGHTNKYMIASKSMTLDSIALSTVSAGTLADMLNKYAPIYVKQNAGGLATIHFRGTSADHTAIMFNGININSLTLGHSNVSNIPTFLFNDVKVQFGSASALYGTDAIAGSIHLQNTTSWNKGLQIGVQQNIASFHNYFTGLHIGYSNARFSYSIKGYSTKQKNDFTFINYQAKDFVKNEFRLDTTKNSSVKNFGILQDIKYNISKKLQAYLSIWYEDDWHEIQPNMSANFYGGGNNEIYNKHLRTIGGLKYFSGKHKLTTDLAYIYDYQLYNNDASNTISTKSTIARVNYYNSNLLKGDLNIGMNYKYIKPEVYAYDQNLRENRFDVFLSYKRIFIKKLAVSVNLRQGFVTNYKSQFSPSLGFNYLLLKNKSHQLNIKTSYSNSFKTPTFNNRYWLPNGNPNLLPENSNTYEIGGEYNLQTKSTKINTTATVFFMDIDNWIQWVNQGGWRPINKKKVESKGLEMSLNAEQKIGKLLFGAGASFTYNIVTEVKSYSNSKLSGEQMMYSPEYMANGRLSAIYKKYFWQMNASFTGERNTESNNILESYLLLDSRLSRNFDYKNHHFSLSLAVNNILNKEYQNWQYYAMPGINYEISFRYNINITNKSKSN